MRLSLRFGVQSFTSDETEFIQFVGVDGRVVATEEVPIYATVWILREIRDCDCRTCSYYEFSEFSSSSFNRYHKPPVIEAIYERVNIVVRTTHGLVDHLISYFIPRDSDVKRMKHMILTMAKSWGDELTDPVVLSLSCLQLL